MLGFFERMAIEDRVKAGTATNDDAARLLYYVAEQRQRIGDLQGALLNATVQMRAVRTTLAPAEIAADRVLEDLAITFRAETSTD